MEMATISIPLDLKESIERYLEEVGLTWTEYLRNEVGYGASSALEKAILEAEASGMCEKTYTSMEEVWAEIDSEEDEVEDV